MGSNTAIAWADHTFNPWWGCSKIRRACEHCYAEAFARRVCLDVFGRDKPRRLFGDAHWDEPLTWDRAAAKAHRRARVFCMSMGDLFEPRDDLNSPRARVFELMRRTTNLDWLVLTKRIHVAAGLIRACSPWIGSWPKNARLGITVGTQEDANEDVLTLMNLSQDLGCGTFISIEPMLEPIALDDITVEEAGCEYHFSCLGDPDDEEPFRVDWVICGCESAPGGRLGRPFDIGWARSLRDQCAGGGVPFFYKQGPGADGRLVHVPELDGRRWEEVPNA